MDIRRGLISRSGFKAVEYKGSESAFKGRIQVTRSGTGGLIEYPDFKQFVLIAREEHIAMPAVETAFGHMSRLRRNSGSERPESMPGALPYYGQTRRLKLGHYSPRGQPVPGLTRGQLVLYDGPTKSTLFGLAEQTEGKYIGKLQTHEGRSITLSSGFQRARKLNIPLQALLQAFGHMIDPAERIRLMKTVHR
jgi:hypothetical protein